jgi:multiple sugar transport system ATP-binding protein
MARLTLDAVSKSYKNAQVIHDVSLDIGDGEFLVLVGPSGCGKSTLLRMIAGLEEITSGELRIDGVRMNEVGAADRGLAMVFQSYALYPHMSIYRNMAFGLENAHMPRAEIARRVERAAKMLRLDPYLERRPGALSGGQRQRAAIGRAIVRDPKAFLFDEPLSNLDAELRVAMRKELAALHAELGRTMVYVTHDQVEAMTLAARIVVLRDGRIEQVGTPLELYNSPINTFVAGFIGSPRMNLLGARLTGRTDAGVSLDVGHERVTIAGGLPLAGGASLQLGVRPEHVRVVAVGAGDFDATVEHCEQLGAQTLIYAAAAGMPQITMQQDGQIAVARGDRIGIALGRDALHVFDADGAAIPEWRRTATA